MKTIYVVEDDANIREIEMFALKNSGYEAIGFECAGDFLTCIQSQKPSLILLDIMLPDEDGIGVLKKLREQPDTQELPIILVTAKTTEIDKVKGLDMGADDYITKPFGVMEGRRCVGDRGHCFVEGQAFQSGGRRRSGADVQGV